MALVGQPLPAVKAEAQLLPAGYGGGPGFASAVFGPGAAPPQLMEQRIVAYSKVMKIFIQGSYDLAKEDALASLRSVLSISEQEHLSVRAAAMAEAQQKLQLHAGPGSQEVSVGHSSQPLGAAGLPGSGGATPVDAGLPGAAPAGGSSGGAGGGAKRAAPSTASKAAAAPGGRARTGPAAPAPRAAAGQIDLDPLVGRVVLRNWPRDGGWFSGIVSDFRPETGEHCIIYDMGKPSESFEWFKIRGAAPEACQLQDERVDFAKLALPTGAAGAAGGGAKAQRAASAAGGGAARGAGAGAAGASAAKQQAAGSRQQQAAVRQGAGASKAGAPRAAGVGKAAAGASKPAAARAAAAAAVAAKPPATQQQQPQQQQPQQPAAVAAPPAAQQQPVRNGKTHHVHLANGLSGHAAAAKRALGPGVRPPYPLARHALLPRRTRSWSSDEEDSDDTDEE